MTWAITWLNFPETITYNHVMQAVNDMCQKNVGLMVKKVGCVDHIKSCNLRDSIPCQDTHSLRAAGQWFPAVDVIKFEKGDPIFPVGSSSAVARRVLRVLRSKHLPVGEARYSMRHRQDNYRGDQRPSKPCKRTRSRGSCM